MDTSIYLSQSYQDAWSDYQRSLKSRTFPVWDYIILTASNMQQAISFEMQIKNRKEYFPERTRFAVIPDEGGVRVGSGGATLSVLKWLQEQGGWDGKRILVIHSGGDSKRVPQYSALGKLFSPVPHVLPDGRSSTLFDEFLITMAAVPGRIKEGMLLLSGDVLLLFNPLLIDWSGSGAAVVSFKEKLETGKNHGVYLRGSDGNVKGFLHKQSEEVLKKSGAVNEDSDVDIDTGAIMMGRDVLNSLWNLVSTNKLIDLEKYNAFVNDKVRISLYGDFQYPMAEDSTLEQYYNEKPEGEYSGELGKCRKCIWDALRPYRIKLLRLAPAKFIHFGTTMEILDLMKGDVGNYRGLGWSSITNSSSTHPSYNSVVHPMAKVGKGVYTEVSYVHSKAIIGDNTVLSYVEIYDEKVPSCVVLHGLKQKDGKFVCRIFGINDNPKENKLFGKELPRELGTLWNAPIYQERDNIRDALAAALKLYSLVTENKWDEIKKGKSLAEGFNDADTEAILDWDKRMSELVSMNVVYAMIGAGEPLKNVRIPSELTNIQREWLESHINKTDISSRMRLHYYIGTAMGGAQGEKEVESAFSSLSDAILEATLSGLRENTNAKIKKDDVEIKLPLRVNWGGGWSDTPPYCNENGGTVLNAAILLNGERPVSVRIRRLEEKKIIFESRDMDVRGEFTDLVQLQKVGDPFDAFVLQKAALIACGVIPGKGGELGEILERLGGGIWMDTEVTGVPKGSGLGTSSILAAGCCRALYEFLGIEYCDEDLYATALCMEQIMSTGGGWQDQVGGITDGIKYITSRPGLKQELKVLPIVLDKSVIKELNERFALIYTGQRRLARNLLRDVVGRYIGNEPDSLYALNEIQRNAALQRFELERGNIDAFAKLLNEHWRLSQMIDAGSTNTMIDQIFDICDDLLEGRMICGAGGGGFLQVILKKNITKKQLQDRLKSVFSDTTIGVWDCELV